MSLIIAGEFVHGSAASMAWLGLASPPPPHEIQSTTTSGTDSIENTLGRTLRTGTRLLENKAAAIPFASFANPPFRIGRSTNFQESAASSKVKRICSPVVA